MASTNTRPDTAAKVFHVHRRRARTTRGSFHSEEIRGRPVAEPAATAGPDTAPADSGTAPAGTWRSAFTSAPGPVRSTASRSCSPVRLKRCWKTALPVVAPTLTTAAPRMVP
ncbi:hypothetical protein [Kitasatospora sp. NPDC090091]|uniref:hypothetical protein n=1 Tax=Kitasatospora sp. NPDC090091 TaxID=3364081 RepID=UPI003803A9EF